MPQTYQPRPKTGYSCDSCGIAFESHFSTARFCSQACRNKAKRVERQCTHCDVTFQARPGNTRYCSATCRVNAYQKLEHTPFALPTATYTTPTSPCLQCGGPVLATSKSQMCSKWCTQWAARRRLAQMAVDAERFNNDEIYERDGWVCQLCFDPIDRSVVHPHPLSVSLDHITPLVLGGRHQRANVQCSHLKCNISA